MLYLSAPWRVSESGLRKVMRRLESEEFITTIQCHLDRRTRLVTPTKKLLALTSRLILTAPQKIFSEDYPS
jgi:hypothetical protein